MENLPCSGIPPKATKRAESRILRGRSLRDTTHDYNTGYAVNVRHKTVKRILHSNKVFRQVIKKKNGYQGGEQEKAIFVVSNKEEMVSSE